MADDGSGVSHDELPRLFEPFYRPERCSRDTGGSGLGLAVVHAAVEACGGQAVVSLSPAGGFAVTIRPQEEPFRGSLIASDSPSLRESGRDLETSQPLTGA